MAVFGKSYSPAQVYSNLTGVTNIPIELKANKVYKRAILRFIATVNVTAAGAGVVFNDYGWYALLKSIVLNLSGKNAFDWTPYMFYFIDAFLTDNQGYYGTALPTVANMEATGSYNLELNIPIHFNQPEVLENLTTALLTSTKYVSKPFLEVTPDSLNQPFASSTTTLPVYNLSAVSAYLVNDEITEGLAGNVKFAKFTKNTKQFSASGNTLEVSLPAAKLYRGLVMEVLTPSTFTGSDTLINNISAYNGNSEIVKNLSWADFKNDYLSNYPSDRLSNINTNGRVFIDFCKKSKTLRDMVSTLNNQNVYFEFSTSGAMTLNLYSWTVEG